MYKSNAHKLFIHSEFHGVRCLIKIASQAVELISMKFSDSLYPVGLYARKPVRCISIQPRYRRERLRSCKKHIRWRYQQCSRVMFSDESRYTVTSDSDHQFLWREKGTR